MIKFPFTSFQQFNLDWIMQKLHEILQFMPENGVAGDVLQRTVDGAAWLPMSSVTLDIHDLPSIPDVDDADELAIYDNSQQANCKVTVQDLLDAAAPPVTSVNGQTGAVVLDATDVGALPDTTTIPTDTSDLTNTAGFVDAAGAAAAAPVQSVNGQTGNVIISGGGAVNSVNGRTGAVVVADNRHFIQLSAGHYSVSGDITVNTSSISIRASDDGKYLRLSGYLKITTGTTTGWKRIYYYKNSSLEKLEFTRPEVNIERGNVGIEFTSAGAAVLRDPPVNFTVTPDGEFYISYYQSSSTPTATERDLLIPSSEICTAL